MKLSVSAYRAHASAHKKILSSSYHSQLNYGSTGAAASSSTAGLYNMEPNETVIPFTNENNRIDGNNSDTDVISPTGTSSSGQEHSAAGVTKYHSHTNHDDKSLSHRKSRIGDGGSDPDSDWTKSNQRWMKLRTTVQISSAIQKKPPLKREDSFLKRFSTRQIPETQETVDTGSESASGETEKCVKRRRRYLQKRRSVVNPDENFYFYWLMAVTICVLYNLWTLIVRQSFPELQKAVPTFWFICDAATDVVFIFDILVQLRTGYLEQGLMVYDDRKLACHYIHSRDFFLDMVSLVPFDLLQLKMGTQPLLRFTRFFKVYRSIRFYYIVESRTVWPNLWRVVNLIHILLILAHWFGCFYYLLSEAEGFQGDWVYPYRPGDYATLTRKYLGSLYWSTLTLTTIGDLPTPETNAEYIFTIVSYLIGVFIFATIVGQVGNVITNRNANRLEFERLLDGAKTYMRHHKVPGGMKRRVLRWYDYSWSRGRIQGGGDINTALGLLPDKLKTELALHVNLSVLKKVTIFQECQPEFLHDLVLKMKAYIFTPGDSICRKGEVAREMFIIADGILEVLSETGKVLTTMKAGDFFGEIGILNLDGLNKRTADVRSVGYSELFSLSREDVLAAMKDYPEAQEILQTLGRKRLMEVRCVNKKYAKAQHDKEAGIHHGHHGHGHGHGHGHVHQSDSSENSASKKIVDKLRNDVKGFRNVLKKTRTSRRSDESLEMQPLHSTSPRTDKIMLKRMSRIRSEEKDRDDSVEARDELHDKTPSPIGAGLPLLQRLRLLKEKQDREERAVKSTPQQKSPPHSHVTCTLSPQESIQEEPERELNEGFPLIQRLQQLKIKNDVPSSADKQLVASSMTIPSAPTKSEAITLINNNASTSCSNTISHTNNTPSLTVAQIKPIMKVSFKQRINQLQMAASSGVSSASTIPCIKPAEKAKASIIPVTTLSTISTMNTVSPILEAVSAVAKDANLLPTEIYKMVADDSESSCSMSQTKPIATISNTILKPSIITSSVTPDIDVPIKPWSKLKLATLISSSYTSLNTNCSPDDVDTPLKNHSMCNIPHMMAEEYGSVSGSVSTASASVSASASASASVSASTTASCSASVSSYAGRSSLHIPPTIVAARRDIRVEKSNADVKSSSDMAYRTKFYRSVFDLSPEYSGLPFVKRLKILNERQKLAELERALQTRSFSLDSSKTSNGIPAVGESLYRCYSDASGIYSQFMSAYESSSPTSTNTSTSDNSKRLSKGIDCIQHEYVPLSPESNETLERRQLKSILKKLQSSKEQCNELSIENADDMRVAHKNGWGLPTEPTLKGPPPSAKTHTEDDNFGAFCTSHSKDDQENIGPLATIVTMPLSAHTTAPVTPVNTPTQEYYSPNDILNVMPTIMAMPMPTAEAAAAVEATETRTTTANEFPKQPHYNNNDICPYNNQSISITSSIHSDSHSIPQPDHQSVSSQMSQVPKLEGFPEAQQYFNQILCGINDVIKTHISEVHSKFESQFSYMACEVKRRDAIIAHLQTKLKNLETQATLSVAPKYNRSRTNLRAYAEEPDLHSASKSSSDSSAELLFMRGDSLDTVFTSSPPIQTDSMDAQPSTSRHFYEGHSQSLTQIQSIPSSSSSAPASAPTSYHTYSRHNSMGGASLKSAKNRPERGTVMIADVTGNLTRLDDSVILDIGESSSSSSEANDLNLDDDGDDDDEDDINADDLNADEDVDVDEDEDEDEDDGESEHPKRASSVHHNDWEVRMLAAEMEKQERKRGHSLCENLADIKQCSILLRRRRKFSDTETEHSETETDAFPTTIRGRASSLDQFNLRYGRHSGGRGGGGSSSSGTSSSARCDRVGMFKAMSTDRDKDKL